METRIHNPRLQDEGAEAPKADYIHISWLYAQNYCEYQLFLEHVKGVSVEATAAMTLGREEHQRLEDEFLAKAELDLTFAEAVEASRHSQISTRELYVEDSGLKLLGYIDELLLGPDGFTVIDDKPVGISGKVYPSSKRQVFGYCKALKTMLGPSNDRKITAAVRARGTDDIVWSRPFDTKAEKTIIRLADRIHGLIAGEIPFRSALQAYKCRPCRFFDVCDRRIV